MLSWMSHKNKHLQNGTFELDFTQIVPPRYETGDIAPTQSEKFCHGDSQIKP
jgi:hypothetical protein